jgi:ribosomal-protein-alanine N-acetyltransferase
MILTTQRLVLTPILEEELHILHVILNDAHVKRYLCDNDALSLQQVTEMLHQSQQHFAKERFGLWFIRMHDQSDVIGLVGLWYFFDEAQPQLLYALLPRVLGQGYATEAAARVLDYSFHTLGYTYLTASCDQPNVASQKVAERIGMHKTEEKIVNGNPIVFFRSNKS